MEAIDWSKPIELMDGTQLENGLGSIHGILIPGKAPNGGFHTDLQGCIGGVQVVRNRKEPVKHKLDVWMNLYKNQSYGYHNTKEAADKYRDKESCIACLHIEREFEEGEGLS